MSAIDLVKNLLFLRGELSNEDVEKLYDKYWAGFDDNWWKQTVGTGHAQRGSSGRPALGVAQRGDGCRVISW